MPITWTGRPEADKLLETDPLALLIGLVLDQQVKMEKAFNGPYDLKQRLGHLDAGEIASMDPDKLDAVFRERPALHRFPGNMARRVQQLSQVIAERYGGDAAAVWRGVNDGAELARRISELPGFGDQGLLLSKPRQLRDPSRQFGAVVDPTPDGGSVAAIALGNHLAQLLHAPCHVARKAVQRRPLPENGIQLVRVHAGDLARVEMAEALLEVVRSVKRLLHLDLLVQDQPDQQRQRIGFEQLVGLRPASPCNRHTRTIITEWTHGALPGSRPPRLRRLSLRESWTARTWSTATLR